MVHAKGVYICTSPCIVNAGWDEECLIDLDGCCAIVISSVIYVTRIFSGLREVSRVEVFLTSYNDDLAEMVIPYTVGVHTMIVR